MSNQYIILFALGAMVCWGVADFFVQRMTKRMGNFASLTWINFIGSLVLLPLAIKDFHLITSGQNWLTLGIMGILDFAFGLTLLKAFEKGKLSVVEVLMTMELPLTVILGLAIFKEQLNVLQLLLILMIICGVIFISHKKRDFWNKLWQSLTGKNHWFEKGAGLALTAAIISAFYNFFIAFNSRSLSPILALWLPWTISLFFLIVYMALKGGRAEFFAESKKNLKLIFIGSVIDVASWLFYANVVAQKELSLTTAITESYPLIGMFLGFKFNKEKIAFWQIIGACLALAGVIGIIFIN